MNVIKLLIILLKTMIRMVYETEYYKNFNMALNNCKELSDIHSVAFFVGEEDKNVGVKLEEFS